MKILIVDDEPVLRRMVSLTLEGAHDVVEAADGAAALAALDQHGPFDVVLLDQKMPDMSGVDVLVQIRQRAPDTRVVMLTAHASLDLATEALAKGASHFLSKPMTPALLRAAVQAARPHAPQTGGPGHSGHAITLNGFAVDAGLRTRVERDGSAVHTFTVSQVVGGWSKSIDVHVAPTAFRNSGRPNLPVGGRLAGLIARRALANHLWRDGMLPESGVLRLDAIGADEVAEGLREDAAG
ncbi:MAG: response regulator [Acidobacteriota bacterium]